MEDKISKIALGTVQFGLDYGISNLNGKTPAHEVKQILEYANEKKISVLDTASAYGDSERVLGQNDISQFEVVSKFIATNVSDLEKSFEATLSDLKVNRLYGYLAHRPLDVCRNPQLWEKLTELKEKDRITKIGFSFNTIEEVQKVKEANLLPDIIQIPFNYFDDRFKEYAIETKAKGCEVHSRSTFLQGLFFMNPDELSSFFDPIKDILKEIRNKNLPIQLLNFVLKQDFIDKVVIGVNSLEQLKSNIQNLLFQVYDLDDLNFNIPDRIITPSMWK